MPTKIDETGGGADEGKKIKSGFPFTRLLYSFCFYLSGFWVCLGGPGHGGMRLYLDDCNATMNGVYWVFVLLGESVFLFFSTISFFGRKS